MHCYTFSFMAVVFTVLNESKSQVIYILNEKQIILLNSQPWSLSSSRSGAFAQLSELHKLTDDLIAFWRSSDISQEIILVN